MSDFLKDVVAATRDGVGSRIGNQVICYMERDERAMNFLAIDENDWWGTFIVQYQGVLNADETRRVRELIRELKHLPLPALFQIEVHEVLHEVRAVLRWPLYEDYFGLDDVKLAINILFDCWTTIEPFIEQACVNQDIAMTIQCANEKLAELRSTRAGSGKQHASHD